jgi:hypothetical protein
LNNTLLNEHWAIEEGRRKYLKFLGAMAPVVECQFCKHEVLSSKPTPTKENLKLLDLNEIRTKQKVYSHECLY